MQHLFKRPLCVSMHVLSSHHLLMVSRLTHRWRGGLARRPLRAAHLRTWMSWGAGATWTSCRPGWPPFASAAKCCALQTRSVLSLRMCIMLPAVCGVNTWLADNLAVTSMGSSRRPCLYFQPQASRLLLSVPWDVSLYCKIYCELNFVSLHPVLPKEARCVC